MKAYKIFFMLRKFINDIFSDETPYRIAEDLNSDVLGFYYFLFEENPAKLNRLISDFDEKGIPINKSYVDVENPKPHYYPISIGQYGLAVFNSYFATKDEDKKNHFIRIADWFIENKIEDEELGIYWLTEIEKPEYKIYGPWKSAFTQSRAISILLRAWQITGNQNYYNVAAKALRIFEIDIKNNGVSVSFEFGKFYEEYAANEPTMVLDGHIFSLLGIYDFIRVADKKSNSYLLANNLFNDGINVLINLLPEFDMNFWVKFNLCKMSHYPEIDPCTIGYLKLVSLQLDLLYGITGNEIFKHYSSKFIGYKKTANIFRMLLIKFKALKKLNRL